VEEKIDAFIFGIIISVFIYIAVYCTTRPVVVATDESIIAGQVSTERLAGINGSIREILSDYDRFISESNQRAIGRNLDAEEALDRYDEFVQNCIRSLREIERATRSGESEKCNTEQHDQQGSAMGYNPFLD